MISPFSSMQVPRGRVASRGALRSGLALTFTLSAASLLQPSAHADQASSPPGTAAKPATPATTAAPVPGRLPPQGWWVPATLKLPKAAEGRVAWRFTQKEIITVDKDHKLERRAVELRAVSPTSFKSDGAIALQIDHDEKQNIVTVTLLKPKVAFFTLNPAGDADTKRFDSLVIDVHAEPNEVREICDKAATCARFAEFPALAPKENERSLTTCQSTLSSIRQELAAARRAIPTICR